MSMKCPTYWFLWVRGIIPCLKLKLKLWISIRHSVPLHFLLPRDFNHYPYVKILKHETEIQSILEITFGILKFWITK